MNCLVCGKPLLPREHFRKDGSSHGWYTPKKYCSKSCSGKAASKIGKPIQLAQQQARARYRDRHGYVLLPKDNGYQQPKHRAVMEQMLGRKLKPYETVHHKNGIRHDNRPENLELWSDRHPRGQRVEEQDIWSGMIPSWIKDLPDGQPF